MAAKGARLPLKAKRFVLKMGDTPMPPPKGRLERLS